MAVVSWPAAAGGGQPILCQLASRPASVCEPAEDLTVGRIDRRDHEIGSDPCTIDPVTSNVVGHGSAAPCRSAAKRSGSGTTERSRSSKRVFEKLHEEDLSVLDLREERERRGDLHAGLASAIRERAEH